VILARGRRYFSNDALVSSLGKTSPDFHLTLGDVPSVEVFIMKSSTLEIVNDAARQMH
jgi:hypothetical protein